VGAFGEKIRLALLGAAMGDKVSAAQKRARPV
jgi:hypothetical protein